VLLDTYGKNGWFPYTSDTLEGGFGDVAMLHDYLKTNSMKMFLGIQSAMPSDPDFYSWINKAQDLKCLLNDTEGDITVGQYAPPFKNNTEMTAISQINAFALGAPDFLNQSIAVLANLTNGFDGLYLRGNTPIVYEQAKQRPIVGDPINPEQKGNYTGYEFGGNQSTISFEDIPFTPGFENGGPIDNLTVKMGLLHSGFADYENPHPNGVPEFYVHNLNGLQHHKTVHELLRTNQTARTNVYSESTWPGTGLIGGSWTQPLELNWDSLTSVIAQAMNMALSGVNNWVTEVCGIETMEQIQGEQIELCVRWMELASFLPMARIQGPLVGYITEQP